MNGEISQEDDDDDASTAASPNGSVPAKDGRSASATVHDRQRSQPVPVPPSSASGTSSRHHHHHRQRPDRASTPGPGRVAASDSVAAASPQTARDTFLNYFFGGQGSASAAGRNDANSQARSLNETKGDGSSAAYDMKSLEKHIEAVSAFPLVGISFLTLSSQLPADPSMTQSPREEMETTLIRSLIASYFAIVRQSIQDLIPKAIMHFLVNHTQQHVQNRLVSTLYRPELFGELLHEDETLVNERARVKALLDAYKEAFKTLTEVSLKPM